MPTSLPAATQKLRPADDDLSRIQDNLANPLDKVLAFCGGLQSGSTSESIRVASAASALGFKAVVGPYTYSNAAYPGGSLIGQVMVSTGSANMRYVVPAAGSIVGLSCRITTAVAAVTTLSVIRIRGGVSTTPITESGIVAASPANFGNTAYTKALYDILPGDQLGVNFSWSVSPVNVTAQAYLLLEFAA